MSAYEFIRALPRSVVNPYVVCYPSGRDEDVERFRRICSEVALVYMPWRTNPRGPLWLRTLVRAKRMIHSGFHVASVARIARLITRWKIDLVHTNTSVQIDGPLAARLTGRPHVWHVRELLGPDGFEFGASRARVVRTLYRLSDRVVANSCATADRLRSSPSQEPVVLTNALDLSAFADYTVEGRAAALRESWGVPEDTILVGMCANLGSSWKRHDLFVEAAARVHCSAPDVRFVVCGRVPAERDSAWSSYVQLQERMARGGLTEVFRFVGYVDDVPAMMEALDVLAHPSMNESFGRVVLEAMAAGRPVVVFNNPGVRELIDPGRTGILVRVGDAAALAKELERLVGDRDLRRRLGIGAQQMVEARYSLADHVADLTALYGEVIEERRRFEGA